MMGTMAAGHLVLALLAYVALDFANPLMPGAVDLVRGTVAAIRVEGTQVGDEAVAVAPVRGEGPASRGPVAPGPVGPVRRPVSRGRRPCRGPGRRPAPPAPAPVSDDH